MSTAIVVLGRNAATGKFSPLPLDASQNVMVDIVASSVPLTVSGAVTIADGADTTEGSQADAAVLSDSPGTVSAKLRGLNFALDQLRQDSRQGNGLLLLILDALSNPGNTVIPASTIQQAVAAAVAVAGVSLPVPLPVIGNSDGWNPTEGTTQDAAVLGDNPGSLVALARGSNFLLSQMIQDIRQTNALLFLLLNQQTGQAESGVQRISIN